MILVIVDRFSKKAYFLPCNTMIMSQGVANLYRDHIFKEHRLPKKVISDRGSQFVSGFIKGLYQNLRIEANPSTAYVSPSNRWTDRKSKSRTRRIFKNLRKRTTKRLGRLAPNSPILPQRPITLGYRVFTLHDNYRATSLQRDIYRERNNKSNGGKIH
jgi:hypothetical protein